MTVQQHQRVGRARLPDSGRRIPPGRGEERAVRGPGQTRHAVRVADVFAEGLVRCGAPRFHDAVFTRRGDRPPVRGKGEGRNGRGVGRDFADERLAAGVPEADLAVVVAGRDGPAVRRKGDGRHPAVLGDPEQ